MPATTAGLPEHPEQRVRRGTGCRTTRRIVIHTGRSDQNIEVAITDNGTGVPIPSGYSIPSTPRNKPPRARPGPKHLLRHRSRARREILCRNNEEGPGSTFIVRVPIATEAATAAAMPRKRGDDVAIRISNPSPILLIEDEPSVTAFLRAALERRGYASKTPLWREGLEKLDAGDYSGVISDIRMPRLRKRSRGAR